MSQDNNALSDTTKRFVVSFLVYKEINMSIISDYLSYKQPAPTTQFSYLSGGQVNPSWIGNTQPTGTVLGTTTSSGGGGGSTGTSGIPSNPTNNVVNEPQGPSAEDLQRQYYDQLDSQLNSQIDQSLSTLDSQRSSQEGIAGNTYNQGMNTLNSQLTQGKTDLDTNRQKTLRDLSENMRQSWQQGNAMLGTRGASDSSAAKQYAYALTKFGNQQRGDVQGQYTGQLFKLQGIYDTESKNLELSKNTQLQQIASWFADAQNQLRQQKGQVKLQQQQQAYDQAMQLMQQTQQQAQARKDALDTWALNRATTYQQAAQAMGVQGSTTVAAPSMNNLFSQTPQKSTGISAGYGQDWTKYPNNGYSY